MTNYSEGDKNLSEETTNLRFITVAVLIIILLLTAIYSLQQYIHAKKTILRNITSEAQRLENILLTELDEATYLLSVIARQLSQAPDQKVVVQLFNSYVQEHNLQKLFSVGNVVWVNKSQQAIMDYRQGLYDVYVNKSNDINIQQSRKLPGQIIYGSGFGLKGDRILVGSISIIDPVTQEYLGSLQAYFNMSLLRKRLQHRTKHDYTSFAIIGPDNHVLMQSDSILEKYWEVKEGKKAPQRLLDIIDSIFSSYSKSYSSYLNLMTGQNYHVLQLSSLPSFAMVVSTDPEITKHKLVKKVWFKFVETSAVFFGFLVFIVALYKREVRLRNKVERAYNTAVSAARDKSNFLAYTAHEIRSPLGFILTGSEMMKKQLLGPVPQAYQEYVSGIHQNAQSILNFITDILDEDQIIGGNFKIHNEVVNMASLIRRVIRGHKAQYPRRKLVFKQNTSQSLPLVICDLRRMTQVLNNLVSNAIKYSEEDTTITIEMAMHGEYELILSIRDRGIGMNSEEINIALEKYGAVRKRETNFVESYGLGLAIVKVILDAHQFNISIESATNEGSTVNIILPKHKLIFSSKV